MSEMKVWGREHFPILYEGGEPRAVLVDIATFEQMELVMDNLLNREADPEESILAASGMLEKLIARAEHEQPSENWERELDL